MANVLNLRAHAASLLGQLLIQQGSLSTLLPKALRQVEARDRPLLQELCYGTSRHAPRLGRLLDEMLKKPMQADDQDIQGLLLCALYQLDYMDIPDHAAINETVEATRQLGKPWAAKLCNGVLRRYLREKEAIKNAVENDPVFRFNHPQWLIDKLQNNWPEHWEDLLKANDSPPPFCLRVNRTKIRRNDYQALLEQQEIHCRAGNSSADALYLESACPVEDLPEFHQGWVSVQDEAAQLAGKLLGTQSGDRVLDACAAPGGKLCHLLEIQPDIEIDALEISERRATRIRENLERLGLDATLIIGDAAEKDWWNKQPYDRILVDAPCSATGVIRRNPDIKLLRRNEDIVALANTQLAILTNLWAMLKPGGTLLYATCSIFPQENERIIERFLKQQPDAEHSVICADWGEQRPYGRQLFASNGGPDGFYYARLIRATEAS